MENAVIGEPRKISVIVNIWGKDNATSLYRSLQSVLGQKHKPDEALIVIDGPISKELWEIIRNFSNAANFLVKQIEIPNASGLWNARNIGIQSAEHELIAVHDADDVMHPDRLLFQMNELSIAAVDVLCTPAWEFDVNSGEILNLRMYSEEMIDIRSMFWNNPINHSSVMARKEALIEIGGYRNVHLSEDYDLWLRMVIAGKTIRQSKYVLQALGINDTFLARRSGSKFLGSEKSLHKLFRQTNTFTTTVLWARLLARLSYRMGPLRLRKVHKGIRKYRFIDTKPSIINVYLDNEPTTIGFGFN